MVDLPFRRRWSVDVEVLIGVTGCITCAYEVSKQTKEGRVVVWSGFVAYSGSAFCWTRVNIVVYKGEALGPLVGKW